MNWCNIDECDENCSCKIKRPEEEKAEAEAFFDEILKKFKGKLYRDDVVCNNNPEHIIDLNTDIVSQVKFNDVLSPDHGSDGSPLIRLGTAFLCAPCTEEINAKGVENWEYKKGRIY